MEKKFKVGDKVTYLPENMQGEITAVHSRGLYGLKYPDEDDSFTVNEADLEFTDPKTAFLSDLSDVLRKHNAEIIGGGFDGYGDYLQVRLGNESPFDVGEDNQYDGVVLTAGNIMDYDKG